MAEDSSYLRVGGCYAYAWMTPEGNPTFHGNMEGAQGIYEYRPSNKIYEAVSFSWKQGVTHNNPETRFLLNFDAHERIGYTWASSDYLWKITTFTGFGYHYMGQKLKQPGMATLSFNYNELYVPVGLLIDREITSHLSLGLRGTWMPQVYPAVDIIPLGGAHWQLERTFGNFLAEAPLIIRSYCQHYLLEIIPFVEYWQDGETIAKSPAGFALGVPENTYWFVGVKLNLGGSF